MFKELMKGCMPKRGTKVSACVDVFAAEDLVIGAGDSEFVRLGIAIDNIRLENILQRALVNLVGIENIDHPSVEKDAYGEAWLSGHYLQLTLSDEFVEKGLIQPSVKIVNLDYEDEIEMIIYNPLKAHKGVACSQKNNDKRALMVDADTDVQIKKGDKIGQITLLEHKSYLFGIESDAERDGGFDSTDEKRD